MDNWEQNEMRIENSKKKKLHFGWGVLVGVLAMLSVVAVMAVALVGVFKIVGLHITLTPYGTNDFQTDTGSNVGDNSNSGSVNSNLLNAELLSQIAMIDSYLEKYFLYDVDKDAIRDGMLQGMIEALDDPYSEYYNEDALDSFTASTVGEYVGIGAAVIQENATGIVRISKPYAGTPSAEAGLLPGDIIVAVGDTEVTGMNLDQTVSLIKGEEGTSVILHIYRESTEEYLDIEVTRRKVELPSVSSQMLSDDIGYIVVTSFDAVTTKQFKNAYEDLVSQGMESVIVDMRNNGGGLVTTVEEMLDYLLPEGTIFYVKDKSGQKAMEYISDAEAALDIPMVVLVNEYTASAAEVFAGNIQEFGAGKVVGVTTYGKGVMQQLYYTNTAGTAAVKLTVANYYIHSDKNVNDVGIIPDVAIELDADVANMTEIPVEQDNQLQKAIEVIKGQME